MRWEAAGFVYSDYLTKRVRAVAIQDQDRKDLTKDMRDDHLYFVGQHIYLNMQVFINPMVSGASTSSLPVANIADIDAA